MSHPKSIFKGTSKKYWNASVNEFAFLIFISHDVKMLKYVFWEGHKNCAIDLFVLMEGRFSQVFVKIHLWSVVKIVHTYLDFNTKPELQNLEGILTSIDISTFRLENWEKSLKFHSDKFSALAYIIFKLNEIKSLAKIHPSRMLTGYQASHLTYHFKFPP